MENMKWSYVPLLDTGTGLSIGDTISSGHVLESTYVVTWIADQLSYMCREILSDATASVPHIKLDGRFTGMNRVCNASIPLR